MIDRRTRHRGGIWIPPADSFGVVEQSELTVDVVIPALNEERGIGLVLRDLPEEVYRRVVVVDNGSDDATAEVAARAGATVVRQPERGYGAACLRGLEELRDNPPDVAAFVDADHSDHPDELGRLLAPMVVDEVDLVIGSRTRGESEPGALLPQAAIGNRLACLLLRWMYGYRFSDLGPFRAIRWEALQRLEMADRDFGWTVEMQAKAARFGLSAVEVPVSYRRRVGTSKITGTVRGTAAASYKILYVLFREYLRHRRTGSEI